MPWKQTIAVFGTPNGNEVHEVEIFDTDSHKTKTYYELRHRMTQPSRTPWNLKDCPKLQSSIFRIDACPDYGQNQQQLQVIAWSVGGLWHTVRKSDGGWTKWTNSKDTGTGNPPRSINDIQCQEIKNKVGHSYMQVRLEGKKKLYGTYRNNETGSWGKFQELTANWPDVPDQ